jgi:hypothetical protein
MIPVIGARLRVVEVRIIPSVVLGDGTTTGFVAIAPLVRESTVPTFVSVQQVRRSTPVTGGPFSFFLFGGEVVWSCRVGEGQAWALRSSNESRSDSRRRFCGAKPFIDFSSSGVGGVLFLDKIPSFEVYLLFSFFESSLPLFEVSKLPLELDEP